MKRGKKLALIALTGILVLGGVLGGTVATFGDDETAPAAHPMLNKVAEIYESNTGTALDIDQLQQAFTQARDELRLTARDNRLERLVENGVITQAQADEFKSWIESRPDVPFGQNHMGGERPFPGMHRGSRGPGGFGGGFGNACLTDS